MVLNVRMVLLLLGAVLVIISAFVPIATVDLFKLGLGLVILGFALGGVG